MKQGERSAIEGSPVDAMVLEAERLDADLVVIGSTDEEGWTAFGMAASPTSLHGRLTGRLRSYLLGSVSLLARRSPSASMAPRRAVTQLVDRSPRCSASIRGTTRSLSRLLRHGGVRRCSPGALRGTSRRIGRAVWP